MVHINWKQITFGDKLFDINTRSINPKTYFTTKNFTYIDIDAVKDGKICNPKIISTTNPPSRAKRLIKQGDVLISSVRPYLKAFTEVNEEYDNCVASTGFFVIEDNKKIYPKYFLYFALSDTFIKQTNIMMKGASYPAINTDLFSSINVPVPYSGELLSFSEQKRIADKIEVLFGEIDKAIKKTKEALEINENLLRSKLNTIFFDYLPKGWILEDFEKATSLITDFVANGSFATLRENVKYLKDENYAILLRTKDYSNNYKGPFVYVDKHAYEFLKKSKLEEGDIVACNVGSIDVVFIVPKMDKPMTLGPNAVLIRSSLNKYIYYFMHSDYYTNQIKKVSAQALQPKFNKTQLRKIKIPIPYKNNQIDVTTQKEIVSNLDQIKKQSDKLNEKYKDQLVQLERLKQSILNQAFQGKL